MRRLAQMVLTLFVLITILFFLFRILPGDPLTMFLDAALPVEVQELVRAQFGLDKPIGEQYYLYMRNLLRGEFGVSFYYRRPVLEIIGDKLINTLFLMVASLTITFAVGVLGGSLVAWQRGSTLETLAVGLVIFLRSAPEFWLGMMALALFSYRLPLFPLGGMNTPGQNFHGFLEQYFSLDFLHHLLLPALVSASYYLATPFLVMRGSMIEVMKEDFIEMARAKGLRERQVLYRHGLRSALLPVVTVLALLIGFAIGGQVLIETIFRWPGMGREMVLAVQRNDYPVAQAAFFLMGVTVTFLNFLADLLYGYLDPRVTYD